MGRKKVTTVLDRKKAERLRNDIAAYAKGPIEKVAQNLPVVLDLDDDDIDYEKLYRKKFER
jgi:hypothetical protein